MKVLLGITASVAAILTPKLVLNIKAAIPEIEIKVIATERSLYFFQRDELDVPVLTDKEEWPEGEYQKGQPVPHIDLGDWADLLVIAPLTADTLSDMAHGKADKFLTSAVLAWPKEKSIIVAPAMNTRMWENPITRENLQKVKEAYRLIIVWPKVGNLACGSAGVGAMADINTIIEAMLKNAKELNN